MPLHKNEKRSRQMLVMSQELLRQLVSRLVQELLRSVHPAHPQSLEPLSSTFLPWVQPAQLE
jgi:hypothetical protein